MAESPRICVGIHASLRDADFICLAFPALKAPGYCQASCGRTCSVGTVSNQETALTKSASIPYAVAYNPGFSSVMASPGKISVSKYTYEDAPEIPAIGSLIATCCGRTLALTPLPSRRARHTSL